MRAQISYAWMEGYAIGRDLSASVSAETLTTGTKLNVAVTAG